MMHDVIYSGLVENLNALIEQLPWTINTYMILERLPTRWLSSEERADGIRFQLFHKGEKFREWQMGCIFHPDGELRWQATKNGKFKVLYIGSDIPISDRLDRMEIDYQVSEPTDYLLWGEKLTPDNLERLGKPRDASLFLELQIPRLLCYPDISNKNTRFRLKLKVIEYQDKTTGQIKFYRFHSLEEGP